jgi:DNA-binding NarL/FixJ family response regulator
MGTISKALVVTEHKTLAHDVRAALGAMDVDATDIVRPQRLLAAQLVETDHADTLVFIDAEALLRAIRRLSPDGMEVLRRRLVIAIAGPDDLSWLLNSWETFKGVWVAGRPLHRLAAVLALAQAGYLVLPAPMLTMLKERLIGQRKLDRLSANELVALRCIRAGIGNRDIAVVLVCSETHTKTVVRALLKKLGLPNRTTAAMFAAYQGIEPLQAEGWGGAERALPR